jgi:hypothetical protein
MFWNLSRTRRPAKPAGRKPFRPALEALEERGLLSVSSLQFSSATYAISEISPFASILVSRQGDTAGMASVQFSTSDGTATATRDYTPVSQTLIFDLFETVKQVNVPILNDALPEGDETVNLRLTHPVGAQLGVPNTAMLTIKDANPYQPSVFRFSSPTYAYFENSAFASIMVVRNANAGPGSVHYATSPRTISGRRNYQDVSGTLTFAPGETAKTFTVPLINDLVAEGDDTANLTLSAPTGGTLGSPSTAVLTVRDDDPLQSSIFRFSSPTYTYFENSGIASILVVRNPNTGLGSVKYSTSPGITNGQRTYQLVSGTLTFAPGETAKTFNVPLIDDSVVKGDDTVNLTLNAPTGGTLGSPSSALLTVRENDVAPSFVQFASSGFSANEAAGSAPITVKRTGNTALPVSVQYATSNGTASAGSDYKATAGTLSFAAGETSKTFTIPILDDKLVEGNETVNLTLRSPIGGRYWQARAAPC